MNIGNLPGPLPENELAAALNPELQAYVKSLLADPRTLEVWGLLGVTLAKVECVSTELQSLELDSGDWLLVRLSGLPTTPPANPLPTTVDLQGIVRFRVVPVVGNTSSLEA